MVRTAVIGVTVFALAFVIGRVAPWPSRSSTARVSTQAARGEEPSVQPVERPRSPRFAVRAAPARAAEVSPWTSHVLKNPDVHARDGSRIAEAVFTNPDVMVPLEACTKLLPAGESQLRIRTRVRISNTRIEIGGADAVELDGDGELTSPARDCIRAAFEVASSTTPAHPEEVAAYDGPYDLTLSLMGE